MMMRGLVVMRTLKTIATAVAVPKVPKVPKVKKVAVPKTPTEAGDGTKVRNEKEYTLSPKFSALVQATQLTRPQALKALWAYIK
jgi:chromatin remodeling complex protein RSC6